MAGTPVDRVIDTGRVVALAPLETSLSRAQAANRGGGVVGVCVIRPRRHVQVWVREAGSSSRLGRLVGRRACGSGWDAGSGHGDKAASTCRGWRAVAWPVDPFQAKAAVSPQLG